MEITENKITWQAPEFVQKTRSKNWHIYVLIITLVFAFLVFFMGDILFGFLILVSGFALIIFALKKPNLMSFEINKKGIILDNKLHPFSELKSFWIIEDEEEPKLLIKSTHLLTPMIILPLEKDADFDGLEDFLEDYIDEEEQESPLSDKVMDKIGF